MTQKNFSTVVVANLTLNHIHALINSTVVAATAITPSPYGDLINALLANMQTHCDALGEQLNKGTKSPLTQTIIDMDLEREDRWNEIKNHVTTPEKGRNAEKKEAATTLHIFFQPYWNMHKSALNTETDQINDMLTKYNGNSNLVKHAKLIGIDTMITDLGSLNKEFDVLYQQRNIEEGTKKSPSATSLKSAAVKSYSQFCSVVEQSTNFTPNDALTTLFNTIDGLRKKYAPLATKTVEKPTEKTAEKSADKTTISAN